MERIQQLIAQPQLIQKSDLELVTKKVTQYPYAQSYQFLYVLALQKTQSPNFKKELEKRSKYFNYPSLLAEKLEEITDDNVAVETIKPIVEETEKTAIKQTEPIAFSSNKPDNRAEEKPKTEPQTHGNLDLTFNESEYITNLKKLGLEHLIPKDYVEKEVVKSEEGEAKSEEGKAKSEEGKGKSEEGIISNEVETDVIPTEKKDEGVVVKSEEEKAKSEEGIISNEVEADIIPTEENEEVGVVKSEEEIEVKEEKSEKVNEPIAEEVAKSEEGKAKSEMEIAETQDSDIIENSVLFKSKKTFSQWLSLKPEPKTIKEKQEHKAKVEETIEKFIAEKPKMPALSKETKDVETALKTAKPEQINHLMTETLAELYAEQKKYNKAIEAYEILILKNPEKSSIFATRIKELKKTQS